MDEIILTWPNVNLDYAAQSRSGVGFEPFKEIVAGEYGYRLKTGQTLKAIRYHGTNYDIFVQPYIEQITPEGLLITFSGYERGAEPVFAPFIKELPSGGKCEPRALYVEPCGHLFEKSRLADVLDGTAKTDSFDKLGNLDKPKGTGVWYRHCWFRCMGDRIDRENIKNFVKMGQLELFRKKEG